MSFKSILFDKNKFDPQKTDSDYLIDLHLNQIIEKITKTRESYHLKSFFINPLNDIDLIKYRQAVMNELENKSLLNCICSFSFNINTIHKYIALSQKAYYKYHREGWFLESAYLYCESVKSLVNDLTACNLRSEGLKAFKKYITEYSYSPEFSTFLNNTEKLQADLDSIQYNLTIKNCTVKVRKYDSEIDYSSVVEKTFDKFKQGAVNNYKVRFSSASGMNHVEAKIITLVAKLFPEIFHTLDDFYSKYQNFIDKIIEKFDREIQFYIAYLEYIEKFKKLGLKFCCPIISMTDKEVLANEVFDLALADILIEKNIPVVCNNFYLKDQERIFIISGPNQGGKTTFSRVFGQLHYFASLGCPVPGINAKLFLFDNIFTHFEKEEDISSLQGKLQNDLERIHTILENATPNSIIIMNEIFNSTTLNDALLLSKNIIQKIIDLDLLCVWVTFIDELSTYSKQTVSMVSTTLPDKKRTYKVLRKPADGISCAISIAEKYQLTYECLKERIK